MSKFYGVGVGPGDPDLMTVKAVKVLKEAKYIFIPKSRDSSMARDIAEKHLSGKDIIELEFPMGEDNSERYREAALLVKEKMEEGDAAFITLGDPMTYSTYIYMYNEMDKLGISIETVPGISAYSASAAKLNIPLAVKNESMYICERVPERDILKKVETVCIFKGNRKKEEILDLLESEGFTPYMIKRVSSDEEEIVTDRNDILKIDDYMSMIIGRKN